VAETSISLLERLREPGDATAWRRLVDLYTPLMQFWLRRASLQQSDVDDLVQEVLAVVVRKAAEFQHDGRPGSFRSWLRAITVNRLRDHWRALQARAPATGNDELRQVLAELEDPHSGLSRLWDEEHDRHVLSRLLELIEPEFKPATWRAFRGHVIEGRPAEEVARELNLSANAVFIAKSRVMHRLREEARDLVDEPPALS
jgi:RNA polymerase sigma-70 factor (ECF subfamily)